MAYIEFNFKGEGLNQNAFNLAFLNFQNTVVMGRGRWSSIFSKIN